MHQSVSEVGGWLGFCVASPATQSAREVGSPLPSPWLEIEAVPTPFFVAKRPLNSPRSNDRNVDLSAKNCKKKIDAAGI